jgi:hypothetical protein
MVYTLSLQLTLFCLYRATGNFKHYEIMLSILNRALQTLPKSTKLLSLKDILTDGTKRKEQKITQTYYGTDSLLKWI